MDGWTQRAGPDRAGPAGPRQAPAAGSTSASSTIPAALVKLDACDKKIAVDTLQRKFDPDAPLFIDFDEHVRTYEGTDRRPVFIRH